MNIDSIFRLLTIIYLVAGFGVSGYYRRKADQEGGELDKSEGQGLLVFLRLFFLLVILPLFGYLINPAWVEWARLPLPLWLRWTGAAVGAATIPFIVWVFRSIGQNISPTQTTRESHVLITHGPYRWIRHPLYTGGFVFYLSLSVMTSMWWLAAGLLMGMVAIGLRTPREEEKLVEFFGEEYREYMEQTGRYFPRL
jgi:protein-S-isoprenylcysteine O-methyltransferase Ste14